MTNLHSSDAKRHEESGFTLVELMVALLIGLFLMGGLMTLLQNNRRTFSNQNLLSQLQDSERLAMTMMTGVIQQAGYFPDPTTNTPATSLTASGSFAAGQGITGTYSASAPGDTISVRYRTAPNDGILNCIGGTNTSASNTTYVNTFSVVVTGGFGQLVCTQNGTAYPLVGASFATNTSQINITNMVVLFGVNTSGSGSNVDTYMTATQVNTAAAWNNVVSVKITLTFTNPLAANNPGQPATIQVQRYISLMRQT